MELSVSASTARAPKSKETNQLLLMSLLLAVQGWGGGASRWEALGGMRQSFDLAIRTASRR